MHIISLKLEQEANFFRQSIAYNDISEWGQRRHRVANEQLQVSASAHYFRLATKYFCLLFYGWLMQEILDNYQKPPTDHMNLKILQDGNGHQEVLPIKYKKLTRSKVSIMQSVLLNVNHTHQKKNWNRFQIMFELHPLMYNDHHGCNAGYYNYYIFLILKKPVALAN